MKRFSVLDPAPCSLEYRVGAADLGEEVHVFHVKQLDTESCTERYSSQCKNNCFAEMWSGSEAGSYLRLINWCITQLYD